MSLYLEDLGRFPRGSDAYDEIRKMRMKEGDWVGGRFQPESTAWKRPPGQKEHDVCLRNPRKTRVTSVL